MKKLFILIILLGGFALKGLAQSNDGKWNIAANVGLPVGDASNVYNSVLGVDIKYEYPAADNLYITASAGYSAFITKSAYKDAFGLKSSYGFVPLKAGLKGYIQQGLFLEGQIGAAISTENGGGTAFAYAPGIGYTFDGGFEAGVRYEGWSKDGNVGQVSLRLGFRF